MARSFPGTAGLSRYALFAGVAALALPGAAYAQDAGAQQDTEEELAAELDERPVVVVTATKREQTLQETPVAVSVTSADTIEQAQIRDIADLQSVVPSLRVSTLQSAFSTSFSVRGFGTDGNNLGLEPSVAVFVDGVYRSRAISQISDLPNLQRVEVLRGPQSTLFGKNASAGVISIVSAPPSLNELEGSLEATYGNFNALVLKGYVTGGIIEDTLGVSISGGYNRRDGFVTNGFNGDDLNDRNRWFARGQMLFDNGGPFTLRLIGDYDEIDEKCCAVLNIRPSAETGAINAVGGRVNDFRTPFNDVVFTDVVPFNRVQNWGVSGQMDYDFGAVGLTSITAYRDTSIQANQDVDFSSAALASGAQIGQADIETFTQELRLASDFDGPLNFLVGGYYFKEDLSVADQIVYGSDFRPYANLLVQGATGGALSVPALEGLLGVPNGTFFAQGQGFFNAFQQDNEAFSLFGQVDLELGALTLTAGAAYTDDRKEVTSTGFTTDAFSQIDLDSAALQPLRNQLIVAGALAQFGVDATNPAAVGAFATNPATAPIFANILAAAAAQSTNPATNPLGGLRPFQFLPPILNIPNAVEDGRTNDGNVSYILRAAYEVSPSINAYISYATGFKASSFNLSRDSRPLPADFNAALAAGLGVPNLRPGTRFALPEESTVYELGVKGNWGFAAANLTFFLQNIENFQANTFVGSFFVLSNAGEQQTFGIEFDGYIQPTDELTLNLAATYLDPKYVSFVGSPVGDLSGETVGGVHPLSLSVGVTWDKELVNGDSIIIRTDYQHEANVQVLNGLTNYIGTNPDGSQNFAPARAAARPFTREVNNVNASITYAMDMGLEFSVWARNLLDDRYITTIFPSVAQGQSISGYPNQPRTYGATARFKF